MFCPNCAAKNPDDARFCGDCGKEMPGAAPANPDITPVAEGATATISNGLKYGIVAATVIIPFIGIVMGLIYMFGGATERKPVGKLWLVVGIFAMIFWIAVAGG